jgi:hypothetical protein
MASSSLSTYNVTRIQLLEAIRRLETAGGLVRRRSEAEWGSHLVVLRPALVLTAKAAWIVRPDASQERVARAVGIVIKDQQMGARAMHEAVVQGAPLAFKSVSEALTRTANLISAGAPSRPVRPLGDQALIRELATDVDCYYGSSDAATDMQLLWNASSSLAHGERWFSVLAGGRRAQIAETLTTRSLDAVCSSINVTSLRLLSHALAPRM